MLNGTSLTTTNLQLPTLNGWNNYGTYTLRNLSVAASGTARLVLNYVNPNFNLNWFQFVPTNQVTQLAGTIIGTPGSWNSSGNTITNVFDGNLNSYFDAPTNTGAWVGLDLGAGATTAVCRVQYCPRTGYEYRMPGGMIQGANVPDFSSGVVTLFTLPGTNPPSGVMSEQNFYNYTWYRYFRYLGSTGNYCNIAELKFFGQAAALTPIAPSGLSATVASSSEVDLSWVNNATNATGFSIERMNGTNGAFAQNATVSSNVVACSDRFYLAAGNQYYYRVRAFNPGGYSSYGAQVMAITLPNAQTPPSGLVVSLINAQPVLSWLPPTDAVSYNVKRGTNSGGPYTVIANTPTPIFTDNSATNASIYYYVVSYFNSAQESGDSAEASVSFPGAWYPFEGNVLDQSGNGNNGVNYAGSYIAGKVGAQAIQFNGVSTYTRIPLSIGSTNFTIAFWIRTTASGGGTNWYSGKGLVDGYVSTSVNDFGTALVTNKFALGIGNPDTTFVSAKAINDGLWHHVAATWNASSGAVQLYVDGLLDTSGSGPSGPRTSPPNLRIGSIQTGVAGGFLNGSVDDLRLYNTVLPYLALATLATSPPNAPGNLAAAAGVSQVSLNWNAATSATSYNVKRATVSGGPYSTVTSLTATNYTDFGLVGGTNYFYVVSAVNPGGEGVNSLQVSATPIAPPAFVLIANTVTNNLLLTWPAFYNGSHLLIQSNLPGQGLGMIWTDTGPVTNSVVIPLTNGSGSMFFQLRTPWTKLLENRSMPHRLE